MPAAGRPQPGKRPARPAANRTKTVPPSTARVPAPVAAAAAVAGEPRGTALDWVSFVLICASAVFCSLLELMLIPLYLGSVIVPLSVVAAIGTNIALPWWGFRTLGRGVGAVVPVVVWLVVLLGLTVVTRPEGDIFVSGAYNQSWVYYGVILLGAIAGFTTVLRVTSPTPRPR